MAQEPWHRARPAMPVAPTTRAVGETAGAEVISSTVGTHRADVGPGGVPATRSTFLTIACPAP